MSEQKTEEEVKPSKNVSDEYWKGYRAGYNKGLDKATKKAKEKKSNLEISVQKETPIRKEVNEVKQPEVVKPQSNSRITIITAVVIAMVLGLVIWYFVKSESRNRESSK